MLFNILLLIIVVTLIIGFFFFTKTGKRVRLRASGTSDQIFEEDASTPQGAAAYYQAKIDVVSYRSTILSYSPTYIFCV